MILGKVSKRVVAAAKLERLPAGAYLSITPLEGFGDPAQQIIAIDAVNAGPGDTVLILQEGTGAREALLKDPGVPLPAQMVVIGVVDQISE